MTKLVEIAAKVLFVAFGAFFLIGFIAFPDAPIRSCGEGYCGKQGQVRNVSDYQRFRIWEGSLPWLFALTFAGAIYLNRGRLGGTRENK